jgi:hypothetical protein
MFLQIRRIATDIDSRAVYPFKFEIYYKYRQSDMMHFYSILIEDN